MRLQKARADQQYQFGQSDYVEAVEGCSAEGDVEYFEEFVDRGRAAREQYVEDDDDGFEDDDGEESCVELDDGEYIEEEHEMTLDEFYAQAQKQLLANGFNSKEEANAL